MSELPDRRVSPAVYRRRRLVVLLVVLAVIIAVVWLSVAQPWRGVAAERPLPTGTASNTASTVPSPSASAPASTTGPATDAASATSPATDAAGTGTPSPSATERTPPPEPIATSTAAACTAKQVTVDAVTDQSTYPSGQLPKLSIRLTNHGTAGCTMNVGTTQQVLTVTSGSDTWWRSTDCQSEPSDMVVLIAAGQTVTSAQPVEWDRTRSAVSSCGGDRPRAPGGGASYHLKVSIGGITSSQSAQFLLY